MESQKANSFLRLIQRSQRGNLKIYIGYSAGVGKTWLMLQEALRLRESGIDIVAGLVETHEQEDTNSLLSALEIIVPIKLLYRGITITEMDIDAILQRRPSVVLVDDLAHTNVPGGRHSRRYEDVEEMLAAGIHVIATLNIQHLESLHEQAKVLTGVKARELLPDRILSRAEQIVNVDITIPELCQRLGEGKIYLPGYSKAAVAHCFREENLERLRELTIREVAAQMESKRRTRLPDESLSTQGQLMVCLNSKSLNSEAMLCYASRMAERVNRNWYVVSVQTLAESPAMADGDDQPMLSASLARELGASVFTYKGDDVVKTILQFAREYRVGHIIIGKSSRKLSLWQRLQGRKAIAERLIAECKGINVIVLDTRE